MTKELDSLANIAALSPFYQELKGKREGIVLALDIINRRDVNPTSVRWLIKEKEIIEYQMKCLIREGEEE
tara:strand:+ start:188 stop:397 length:210 start_codon:yes stop_codon:yes gene_type:complete